MGRPPYACLLPKSTPGSRGRQGYRYGNYSDPSSTTFIVHRIGLFLYFVLYIWSFCQEKQLNSPRKAEKQGLLISLSSNPLLTIISLLRLPYLPPPSGSHTRSFLSLQKLDFNV